MINYRNTSQIAQQVTVRDLLDNPEKIDTKWVENRVVLIGYTTLGGDIHDTPKGKRSGVYIHANVISQIISFVENDRPFLQSFSQSIDYILILFWSLIGGLIVGKISKPLSKGIGITVSIVILYRICWFLFTKGWWIPLIPSVFAIIGTAFLVVVFSHQNFPRK
jgi:adenylate cyclase